LLGVVVAALPVCFLGLFFLVVGVVGLVVFVGPLAESVCVVHGGIIPCFWSGCNGAALCLK